MVVEFRAVTAIDSLVELLKVAENQAVHCYEQEEPFHPGLFPGLILLARFASQRAGEEFRQAIAAAEQIRKLNESCDELRHSATDRDTFRDGLHELKKEFDQLREQLAQVTAERDELRAQLAKARAQEAELSGNPGELPAKTEPPEWHRWKHGTKLFHPRHPDIVRCVHDATAEDMERWYRGGWRELVEPEPASESYQWQVGDEVINRGDLRAVDVASEGWIKLDGLFSCCRQTTWERAGWKLYRKASDLGVQQLTPRQVEISDSGTDGEGQP